MKRKIPSVEQLKSENCPAAVALLMYEAYKSIPDVQLNSDGQRNEDQLFYIDNLVKRLSSVRTFEDLNNFRRYMFAEIPGLVNKDEGIEEQFKSIVESKDMVSTKKLGIMYEWLGFNLTGWIEEDAFKGMIRAARANTGESLEKLSWEKNKEYEAEGGGDPRYNVLSEEEKKFQDEEKRRMEMRFSQKSYEIWHQVKVRERELKQTKEKNESDWKELEQEELLFINKFGLKGVRFPYAMSLEKRKKGLEELAVNLEQIAKTLNMPETNIGFRGRLPIFYGGAAFGSLGTYTYLTHTLYILEGMSKRATTHEWFHALDYDLSYQSGISSMSIIRDAPSFSKPNSISSFVETKEARNAMIELLDYINNGEKYGSVPVDADEFIKQDGIFWKTLKDVYIKEMFRLMPEENKQNAVKRCNFHCTKFFSGEISPDEFTDYFEAEHKNSLSLTKEEEKMFVSYAHEIRILSGLYLELKENPTFFKNEREKGSFFKWFAHQLDYKIGKDYYTIPTEMFARLGEQYVFDRLEVPMRDHKSPQYLLPFEKEKVQVLFENFVNEARHFLDNDATQNKRARPSL